MRHSTSIPATFRIAALFILSATILGAGSPPATGQPAEDPAPTSTVTSTPSSVSPTADAVGPALHSSGEPVRDTGTDALGTVRLDTPEPPVSTLSPSGPQGRPSRSIPYKRWRALWSEFASPAFLFGSLGPAIGDHLNDDPASWRSDALGYGFRVASSAGRLLLEGSAAHGLAATIQLDLRFRPKRDGGVASRLRHTALEAVTARTPSGTRIPNAPRIAGTYGAVLAQQRWQSGGVRPGDAALSAALSLGIDVAVNVIVEFAGTP
jgi:hypothetical protein